MSLSDEKPAKASITAYKGFDRDMKCRGFQFVEGETYEHEGEVVPCRSGFHATLMPLHVLRYYPPATSEYHVVQVEEAVEHDGDSKVAARKLTVGAKIGLPGLIEAQIQYVTERAKPVEGSTTKANNGAATASGWYGAATASGWYGAAKVDGKHSVASATGCNGKAAGAIGCVLLLIERDPSDWRIIAHRSVMVDGETIKADTFYVLRGGKVVEA